jgi:uroporphyrinogen decarboxylase
MARIDDLEHWCSAFGVKGEEGVRSFLQMDMRKVSYSGTFRLEEGKNIWGASEVFGSYHSGRGSYPLADAQSVADIEHYNWPAPEALDMEMYGQRVDAIDKKFPLILSIGFLPVLNTVMDMFGMEEALVLMLSEPEIMEAAIAHIETFLLETMKKVMDAHAPRAFAFWLGDDFSTQRGMMISPESWRKFLKPTYKKLFDLVKSYNLLVWFHSCGTFRPVMPDLIDIGMDIWETVQAHLEGNDPRELKNEFGAHLTFFGAINCQQTLPFGSTDDVRREVRERIRILGKGGGYICGPDHSIQANMPPENIIALYDEIRKYAG